MLDTQYREQQLMAGGRNHLGNDGVRPQSGLIRMSARQESGHGSPGGPGPGSARQVKECPLPGGVTRLGNVRSWPES
jgi:hypothetical protein